MKNTAKQVKRHAKYVIWLFFNMLQNTYNSQELSPKTLFLHVFRLYCTIFAKTHAKRSITTKIYMTHYSKYNSKTHWKSWNMTANCKKSRKTMNYMTFVSPGLGCKALSKITISHQKRYFCTFFAFSAQNDSKPMQALVIWTKSKIQDYGLNLQIYKEKSSFMRINAVCTRFSLLQHETR